MLTPYTEDCISLTGVFEEPFGHPIYTEHMETALRMHALATGMSDEEAIDALFKPGNYLYLQPDFGHELSRKEYAFIPPDRCIQLLTKTYRQNQRHPQKDRTRAETESGTLEYSLIDLSSSTCPIFLRHPATGIVTKHVHPYPAFPSIRLRSADPSFIAIKTAPRLSLLGIASDVLQEFSRTFRSFLFNPPLGWYTSMDRPPAPKPPIMRVTLAHTDCSTSSRLAKSATPPMRKRQRDTAPPDACPPPKRSRGTPCIPIRRNPPRAAKTKAREAIAPSARRRRGP
ncbi:hypothetical protein CYLTODRAFT_425621 [Cylindrobasidium torrendii FP15055 ss-10]|uniref:Uncharacterized protein n=1 Tax=Cylindrobasidium torrendii FP15055 ss-10 TaxID=1314674 RepID=A0A0D7B1E0_9AGAR|nr:hypothetical protein CYLTODRAFT_425621 [Cylindrobasidium torrendii FP15055 ss-10]